MTTSGFWRRFAAYLIDILPITLLVFGAFYIFFGFDEVMRLRNQYPGDPQVRAHFLSWRNHIRDMSFLIWIVYATITEGSRLQGTLGKKLMRLRVTDMEGNSLTVGRSIARNLSKIVSLLPLGLGFVWAAFRRDRRAWHDLLAKTRLVHDV